MYREGKPTPQSLNFCHNAYAIRTRNYIIALVGLLLGSIYFSHSADAQSGGIIVDREAVAKELSEKHREETVGMGLADNGGVLELFTSEGGETWTVLLTMPNGASFVVGTGKAWAGKPVTTKGMQI